jgi:hypothetical protein
MKGDIVKILYERNRVSKIVLAIVMFLDLKFCDLISEPLIFSYALQIARGADDVKGIYPRETYSNFGSGVSFSGPRSCRDRQ